VQHRIKLAHRVIADSWGTNMNSPYSLKWRALAGMRLCVAHPDQGLIHRPTNGGHCGGDGSVLRLRAAVARTNWRGLAA
jgi:hypothetical protein